MKKRFINEVHFQGYFYDHKLEEKVSGPTSKNPGTQYIAGVVYVATDEALLNVVPVYFRYVTATTSKGNSNATYVALKKLIDDNKTVVSVGKDNAEKLRIDSNIRLNEWYRQITDEKPQSVARAESGFVHIVNDIDPEENMRNKFKTDMLITNVKLVEADEERHIDTHVVVRGAIFEDYSKTILPVQFVVRNKKGMDYFLNLEPTGKEPIFTCVWGRQLSQTVRTETKTESAFGEPEVVVSQTTTREFVITGASSEPYVFDDEETLTKEEVSKMMSDRELYLATLKKNQEEYQKNRNGGSTVSSATSGDYDF